MANCVHNQVESFKRRYFKDTPVVQNTNLNYGLILRIVERLTTDVKKFYKPEFNFHKYVASKPGSARRRFLKAVEQLRTGTRALDRVSRISAFVKNERYFAQGKAPRLIMGRDPRFNVYYARFIARFEDAFFQLPQVANACDYQSCGDKFSKLYRKSSRMFENDMSAYESSQRWLYLALEFLVYAWVCPEDEVEDLKLLFATKLVKSGRTEAGLKFYFEICRGSADLDTGCGNGVGNYIATAYFKIVNFCPLAGNCRVDGGCCGCLDFVVKGDDSYGTVPERHTANLINTYAWFGLDAKLIYRPDGRLTEFCSGHFIRTSDGFTYVQKLRKLITSVSTLINPDFLRRGQAAHYYRSLGDMYAVLYKGVPVYSEIAEFLQTSSSRLRINVNMVQGSYGAYQAFSNTRSVQKIGVCPETLLDISMVNEMSLPELECLATHFRTHKLKLPPEYQRRCNLKGVRANATIEIPHDIHMGFDRKLNDKRAVTFKRELDYLLKFPSRALPQIAKRSQ